LILVKCRPAAKHLVGPHNFWRQIFPGEHLLTPFWNQDVICWHFGRWQNQSMMDTVLNTTGTSGIYSGKRQ
jgi:hypothetical protein